MAQEDQNQIKLVLNVLRRMPPKDVDQDLIRVLCLVDPNLEDEICQRVDVPLEVKDCQASGKPFVINDYNRDGDSHRSPWSNKYYPPIEEGLKPTGELRKLELTFNGIFDVYRRHYYEGGVSSVYLWELSDDQENNINHFAGSFVIKKPVKKPGYTGTWNSVHVVEVKKKSNRDSASYKVTSTVLVNLLAENPGLGQLSLSGSSSKIVQRDGKLDNDLHQSHVTNIGKIIEEVESVLQSTVESQYFGKTNEVICGIRVTDAGLRQIKDKMANIATGLSKKN